MKRLKLTIIFLLFSIVWFQPTIYQAATTNKAVITFKEPEEKITPGEETENENNSSENKQQLPKTGVENRPFFFLLGSALLVCSYLVRRKIKKG
ncbi:LPXTG-motif protein cell wall anchor domain protein [Enterococcus faecalis 13-SD-W-01]|nr:LPXTG-motif protein cell wall anchor domain protein [Enterococcus faecalis 13-SD-W-01]